MSYIDGYLIPVPTASREVYRAHEEKWWPFFEELGAGTLVVGWGDDVPAGKQTDFLRAVDLKPDETVVFCWITWPDKATRSAAHKKMMETMPDNIEMPFDGKRLVYGGFQTILEKGGTK